MFWSEENTSPSYKLLQRWYTAQENKSGDAQELLWCRWGQETTFYCGLSTNTTVLNHTKVFQTPQSDKSTKIVITICLPLFFHHTPQHNKPPVTTISGLFKSSSCQSWCFMEPACSVSHYKVNSAGIGGEQSPSNRSSVLVSGHHWWCAPSSGSLWTPDMVTWWRQSPSTGQVSDSCMWPQWQHTLPWLQQKEVENR